jgi:hypothetical protein
MPENPEVCRRAKMAEAEEASPTTPRGLYLQQLAEGLENQAMALDGLWAILGRRPDSKEFAIQKAMTGVRLSVKCLEMAAERLSHFALADREVPENAL